MPWQAPGMLDTAIIGGTVIDGTGGSTAPTLDPRRKRRRHRGADDRPLAVDDDLVVTPGFVDPHTHYDALFWDPLATPSSWHGVTSVIGRNCGSRSRR